MEPLEKNLLEMGKLYRKDQPLIHSGRIFEGVLKKIKEKEKRTVFLKGIALATMALFSILGIMVYSSFDYGSFGTFFSVYMYVFFAISMIAFVLVAVLNSQQKLEKLIGKKWMKKVNQHEFHFIADEDDNFFAPKAH